MKAIYNISLVALGLVLGSPNVSHAADSGVGTGKSFKGPVGLQLYSLRGEFASQGVPKTLQTVEGYGIRLVETAGTYNLSPERFTEMLKEHKLKAISGHFSFDKYRDDPESIAKEAKALGLKFAGCAWIPHQGDFDEAEALEAARVFNHAGEVLAKDGIQFFYHCHGYEFQPYKNGTLFDLLAERTDKKNVAFEMDIYWVIHPGQDPVAWFKKLGSRWQLVHLKDKRKGVAGDLSGGSDVKNDVIIGTGQVDWPAVLAAAKTAGVKYYFIEDESPWAATQIPTSLEYLSNVKF